MKQLVCEMCGSTDLIKQDGVFVCQACGCKYSVEEARKMMIEGTVDVSGSTVKIDETEAINEQVSTWEKMAGDAFNNSNYSEAYTYYCKILEKRVGYWFATYRKGMCQGWQANLKNMHANEVLGGVVDATKLLYADTTQTDVLKANGTFIMATELHNWIQAVSNLVVNHCNEYGNQLVSAAKEFYQQECSVSELIKFNLRMISEFVYENYENKENVERVANAICSLGQTTLSNMNSQFRVKTGSKYNTFWCVYEDVFEDVRPDYRTTSARNELSSAIFELQNNLKIWKENYRKKVAEQRERELDEKRKLYWECHPEEYAEYKQILDREKDIKDKVASIEASMKSIESKFEPISKQYDSLSDSILAYNNEIERLSKKIFGKKKALEEIDSIRTKLEETKELQMNLEPSKCKFEQAIMERKQVLERCQKALQAVQTKIKTMELHSIRNSCEEQLSAKGQVPNTEEEVIENGGLATKLVCPVCGYIHAGTPTIEACPICKVPVSKFTKFDG